MDSRQTKTNKEYFQKLESHNKTDKMQFLLSKLMTMLYEVRINMKAGGHVPKLIQVEVWVTKFLKHSTNIVKVIIKEKRMNSGLGYGLEIPKIWCVRNLRRLFFLQLDKNFNVRLQ